LSLLLNFSPIEIDDAQIGVGTFPYGPDGEQALKALRQEHWKTHVFRRDGAAEIVAVGVTADAPKLGTGTRTIRLKDNLGLSAALIRNSLLNTFAKHGRSILNYDPIRFIARDDILRGCVPQGVSCPDWLGVRLLYEVVVRPVYFFKREPFIAAILDVRTTRLIERSVAELIVDGFSPVNFYVTGRRQGEDSRISPKPELMGRVSSVNGTILTLTDARSEASTVDAKDVWLEKKAFPACVNHIFQSHAENIAGNLEKARAELRQGPARLQKIKTIVDFLGKESQTACPGVTFKLQPFLDSNAKGVFPTLDTAPKPTYIFDPNTAKTSSWHDGGIDQHGPYTAKSFTPTRPRLCVICQRRYKGQIELFLNKFINGVVLPPKVSRQGKPLRNYFEKGLLRKYALQDVTYEFFLADDQSPKAYKDACRQALEKIGSGTKWDLALVQIEESFHQLPVQQNPYFIAKESFLTLQIPVQEFEIETTQKEDRSLAIIMNNMALATYAKMGGIPWLLRASPPIAHELVIGLGSAIVADGRLGERERYVGITTVFSSDGNYHLSNTSKAVTAEEYPAAFLDALRKTVTKVRQDMNWQPKDNVRLIFHATFKKFSQNEVNSVKSLMKELGDYEVEYAFLQVSDQHPYLLFDTGQAGSHDFETRSKKGVYAPQRAGTLQLSNRDVLLCLTGPSEVKRPEDGLPRPVLLSLHKDSTFTDMTYLSRQVFTFACHSWRTFLPSSVPVTIQYSDLIARTLGNLSFFDRWDPDVMLGKIGKTRWFL
jgi:hypothetical protein